MGAGRVLYMGDYRTPGSAQAELPLRLRGMLGSVVTVYTVGGGAQGRGFKGVLCETGPDFLRLRLLPSGRGACCGRSGTGVFIPLRQVTAVSFYTP